MEEEDKMLTEPIMDASYLDDEIGMIMLNEDYDYQNYSFSPQQQQQRKRCGLLSGLLNRNLTIMTSANNNTEIFNSSTNNNELLQQGEETIASITGSILEQLDFDDDDDFNNDNLIFSCHENNVSCEKLLFSASVSHDSNIKPELLLSNFSTDSLDKSVLNYKLNLLKNNYTIAFQNEEQKPLATKHNYKSILTQSCPIWIKNLDTNSQKLASILTKTKQIQTSELETMETTVDEKVLICYPRYTLPDLTFLKKKKSEDNEKILDWESLQILLPAEYKEIEINKKSKPLCEREKIDLTEKEIDEKGGGVKMRNKYCHSNDPYKRFSNQYKKNNNNNKFKRFSLQEIQEIQEITKTIDLTLQGFNDEEFNVTKETNNTPNNSKNMFEGDNKCNYSCHSNNSNNNNQFKSYCCKSELTSAVVEGIMKLSSLKKEKRIYSNSNHGKLVLEILCPALYCLLSDGLSPHIDTIFGRVHNTVWRVVEASIQQGPTSQTMAELVLRINSEQDVADGPLKFNAFICGLLNVGSLSGWLTFLRTKERLLRTHYCPEGFLYLCNTTTRWIYDQMLVNCLILNKIHYNLDIFYETKLLHTKIKKVGMMKRSFSDERPKKHKNNSQTNLPKSKTHQNINSPQQQPLVLNKKQDVNKFKKLQLQWEMIASNNNNKKSNSSDNITSPTGCHGSKIPRPISRPQSAYLPPSNKKM